MSWRALSAAVLLLSVAGCRDDVTRVGDLRVTGEIRPAYEHRPAPAGSPSLVLTGLEFADRLLGVGIVDGDRDPGIGQIQLTRDGGRTWRTVFRGAHVSFTGVSLVGRRHMVVLGGAPPPKQPWNLEPFVWRSDDAGRTWRRFPARMPNTPWPLSIRFVTPSLGFGLAPVGLVNSRTWLLRTTDGGHTWRNVPKPSDAGFAVSSVDFVSPRNGFATSPRRCGAGLYRTGNGGATWRPVPGSCIHGVLANSIDFQDSGRGLMAGGSARRRVVLATSNAGRTWQERSSVPGLLNVWTHIVFDRNRTVGWGRRSICDPFHPPCASGGGLWHTSDGGATWRRQRLSPVDGFDALDGRHAWVGSGAGFLWQTTDGGRSWSRRSWSRSVVPRAVSVVGRRVVLQTDGGYLGSTDAGRTWHWLNVRLPKQSVPGLAVIRPGFGFVLDQSGRSAWLSADTGRTWRKIRLPVAYPVSISFSDARSGILAASGHLGYSTGDGGRTWTPRHMPFNGNIDVVLAAAPGLITESAGGGNNLRRVALSHDGGKSWRFVELPRGYVDVGATPAGDGTLFLSADRVRHGYEAYLSVDAGRTWQRVRGSLAAIPQNGGEAWGINEHPDHRSLWHSTDGGRHWTEVWPRAPATR
jgi:photosystem II stability/assembly factor-like uncharacterized protein